MDEFWGRVADQAMGEIMEEMDKDARIAELEAEVEGYREQMSRFRVSLKQATSTSNARKARIDRALNRLDRARFSSDPAKIARANNEASAALTGEGE